MQDTLLANVGCLAVFQVAAADARQLIGELDRERVDEEDLVSLPVHHCYVRATADGQRQPTYTMAVRSPDAGDPGAAERVKAESAAYTTPAETIAAQDAEAERLVAEFRAKLDEEDDDEGPVVPSNHQPQPSGNGASGEVGQGGQGKKKRQRRRKEKTPESAEPGDGSA